MSATTIAARMWSVRYAAGRAYFFSKGVYLLLSFDLCFEMIEHGGRYGVGGFNVAHFALLDRLLPLPTATMYVALLIASAGLALQQLLAGATRPVGLLLAVLYTLGWSLSMHDSYQHHYLLSWLLVWCAVCPDVGAAQSARAEQSSGWGIPMAACSCAIVYVFTAIAKLEPVWRSGEVLRTLTGSRPPGDGSPGKFDGARDLLLELGLTDPRVWQLFALSTVALQIALAVGYFAAVQRDNRPSRARTFACTVGLLAALSFHGMAELFRVFEIGLFSYYMLWIALVLLGPARLLVAAAGPIASCARALDRVLDRLPKASAGHVMAAAVGSAAVLGALGWLVPLPGAAWAFTSLGAIALARFALLLRAARHAEVALHAAGTTLGGLVLWLALAKSDVPFDYYRRTAGELSRMGKTEQALHTYRQAELYAPPGQSRAATIRKLESELAKQRPR
jgi:hypothetical protein